MPRSKFSLMRLPEDSSGFDAAMKYRVMLHLPADAFEKALIASNLSGPDPRRPWPKPQRQYKASIWSWRREWMNRMIHVPDDWFQRLYVEIRRESAVLLQERRDRALRIREAARLHLAWRAKEIMLGRIKLNREG